MSTFTPDPTGSSELTVYDSLGVTVYHGDCLDVLRTMPDESVDSVVTDPPYGLGFMGKGWDALPPGEDWARECLRVLKPGGHLLAFGGSRTWHRLMVAVEDAGFEIRDSIAWLYGSGFPKSLDVSKVIDKAAGAKREVVGRYQPPNGRAWNLRNDTSEPGYKEDLYRRSEHMDVTAPATEEARQWSGWGTALKPGFEPIVVARRPLSERTVAANVLEHGTGALNIDGCRIGDGNDRVSGGVRQGPMPQPMSWGTEGRGRTERAAGGRWPTNVVLDGVAADALDAEVGNLRPGERPANRTGMGYDDGTRNRAGTAGSREVLDAGGPSRFFPVFRYQAKAPASERPSYTDVDGDKVAHPTVKPAAFMRWLVRLVTPPGGRVLDPFAGTGTTGEAAVLEGFEAILVERESAYIPLIRIRLDALAASRAAATRSDTETPSLFDTPTEEAS